MLPSAVTTNLPTLLVESQILKFPALPYSSKSGLWLLSVNVIRGFCPERVTCSPVVKEPVTVTPADVVSNFLPSS